ncbi:hypothetical protein IMSAGC014_02110 [Bacteroidaceae bacterium]|nr:hypothetical protein IMSAGC014_02110 [Bacteroidaceae bacterium]
MKTNYYLVIKILLHFPHLKNKLSTSLPAFKLK